jgi:hypothetical protein
VAQATGAKKSIYQLKVTLKGSRPPIWRRVLVPGDIRLSDLHDVLQVVMGWHDYHLHVFTAGGESYGALDPDYGLEDTIDERRVPLSRIAKTPGSRILYEYDFGDSWYHELLVEKILPPDPGVQYPICVTGRRACPPEDIGGIWRYGQFLAAIADPENPDHEELLEWIGGNFDPGAFDLAAINRRLGLLPRRS